MDTVLTVLNVAQHDTDRAVRLEAIEGLRFVVPTYQATVWDGSDAEKDLIHQLLRLTSDCDDEVAASAIETLGEVGGPRVVHPLLRMACDWDAEYGKRLAAMVALGKLEDFRVTPMLIGMLSDPERSLRPWAAYAMGQLCDPRALPELERCEYADSLKLRKAAHEAAGRIRYELSWSEFDRLVKYLKSKNENEQLRAISCLGRIHDPRAGEVLLKVLRDSRQKAKLFQHVEALRAVATAGLEEALPVLAETAEFWCKAGSQRLMREAEDVATYLRRKMNGERPGAYVPVSEREVEKVLDD
jgi:HEAT repeat protein